jgi:hypothetical protein
MCALGGAAARSAAACKRSPRRPPLPSGARGGLAAARLLGNAVLVGTSGVKELRETSSITSHAFAGTTFWGEKLRGHHFWKY